MTTKGCCGGNDDDENDDPPTALAVAAPSSELEAAIQFGLGGVEAAENTDSYN